MTTWMEILDVTLIVGGVLVLVGWCVLCLSLSRIGCWSELAHRYRAKDKPHGERFWMESASIGRTLYPACVNVHICNDGMYLSVLLPFRIGHPPLFIPSTAMHHYRTSRRIFTRRSTFDIGWPRICSIRLRRVVVQSIEGSAMGSRPRWDKNQPETHSMGHTGRA